MIFVGLLKENLYFALWKETNYYLRRKLTLFINFSSSHSLLKENIWKHNHLCNYLGIVLETPFHFSLSNFLAIFYTPSYNAARPITSSQTLKTFSPSTPWLACPSQPPIRSASSFLALRISPWVPADNDVLILRYRPCAG